MNPEENKDSGENQNQKYANEEHEEYDINLLDEEVLDPNQNENPKQIQNQELPKLQPPQVSLNNEIYYKMEKQPHQESQKREDYHSHNIDYKHSESSRKDSNSKYEHMDEKRESTKAFYKREEDSELKIHFYIDHVYWPRSMSISTFISEVRRQVCKASPPEIIQVISYEGTEVTLAVGMRTDKEALAIMRGHKTIYLNDKYRKLYLTSPKPSKPFSLLWEHKRKYGGIWDHPRDHMKKEPSRVEPSRVGSIYRRKPSYERSRSSSRSRNKRRRSFSNSPIHKERLSPQIQNRSRNSPGSHRRSYRSKSRSYSKSDDRSHSYNRRERRKISNHQDDNRYSSHPLNSHQKHISNEQINIPLQPFSLQSQLQVLPNVPMHVPLKPIEKSNQFYCYALGIPLEFGEAELMNSLKSRMNEERVKGKFELPSSITLVKDYDMEYYKLSFPSESPVDDLIFNSLKIQNKYPVMILPHFQDRSVMNSVLFHEILVTSDQKISAISIFQAFSQYGDIISVLEEKDDTFVVIFAQRKSVKDLNLPQAFSFRMSSNSAENGILTVKINVEAVEQARPVKRQLARENFNQYYTAPSIPQIPVNPPQQPIPPSNAETPKNYQSNNNSEQKYNNFNRDRGHPGRQRREFQDFEKRDNGYYKGGFGYGQQRRYSNNDRENKGGIRNERKNY